MRQKWGTNKKIRNIFGLKIFKEKNDNYHIMKYIKKS